MLDGHYAASTWLRLGTPVHEVAKYLGDDPSTVLAAGGRMLGEGHRRAHAAPSRQRQARMQSGTPGSGIV
jgi:hypothetical protein